MAKPKRVIITPQREYGATPIANVAPPKSKDIKASTPVPGVRPPKPKK